MVVDELGEAGVPAGVGERKKKKNNNKKKEERGERVSKGKEKILGGPRTTSPPGSPTTPQGARGPLLTSASLWPDHRRRGRLELRSPSPPDLRPPDNLDVASARPRAVRQNEVLFTLETVLDEANRSIFESLPTSAVASFCPRPARSRALTAVTREQAISPLVQSSDLRRPLSGLQ
ncbi:hypothetical protein NL676_013553 [Syzygium grande]|nr:hypothetical protein NL676_013553 [Syzygium grande]